MGADAAPSSTGSQRKLEKVVAVDFEKKKKKTPRTEGRHKVQSSVDPMFAASLPFPVPDILEFKAFRDSDFSRKFPELSWTSIQAQYDWTTGVLDNGMNEGSSAPYLARSPCVPLFCILFNRGGNRRVFRLPGNQGGDHFHCTVEPSPGHIRVRLQKDQNSRTDPRNSRSLLEFSD